MADSDVMTHEPLDSNPGPSRITNAEFAAPGKAGREAFLGYKQLPTPDDIKPEPEVYGPGDDEVRRAARDLGKTRGASPAEPIKRELHRPADDPDGKYATTVKQAAEQLSADHRFEPIVNVHGMVAVVPGTEFHKSYEHRQREIEFDEIVQDQLWNNPAHCMLPDNWSSH